MYNTVCIRNQRKNSKIIRRERIQIVLYLYLQGPLYCIFMYITYITHHHAHLTHPHTHIHHAPRTQTLPTDYPHAHTTNTPMLGLFVFTHQSHTIHPITSLTHQPLTHTLSTYSHTTVPIYSHISYISPTRPHITQTYIYCITHTPHV